MPPAPQVPSPIRPKAPGGLIKKEPPGFSFFGAFAHLEDWQVLDDGKPVGRLYQRHTAAPPEVIWHWSITEYVEPRGGLRTSGTAETLEAAKAAFRESWDKWRGWATKAGFDTGAG